MQRIRSTFILRILLALAAGTLSANPLPITGYSAVVLLNGDTSFCKANCSASLDISSPGSYSLGGFGAFGEVFLGPTPFVYGQADSSDVTVVGLQPVLTITSNSRVQPDRRFLSISMSF